MHRGSTTASAHSTGKAADGPSSGGTDFAISAAADAVAATMSLATTFPGILKTLATCSRGGLSVVRDGPRVDTPMSLAGSTPLEEAAATGVAEAAGVAVVVAEAAGVTGEALNPLSIPYTAEV
jgi:hypothetical protein